jgi:hypothetical protein
MEERGDRVRSTVSNLRATYKRPRAATSWRKPSGSESASPLGRDQSPAPTRDSSPWAVPRRVRPSVRQRQPPPCDQRVILATVASVVCSHFPFGDGVPGRPTIAGVGTGTTVPVSQEHRRIFMQSRCPILGSSKIGVARRDGREPIPSGGFAGSMLPTAAGLGSPGGLHPPTRDRICAPRLPKKQRRPTHRRHRRHRADRARRAILVGWDSTRRTHHGPDDVRGIREVASKMPPGKRTHGGQGSRPPVFLDRIPGSRAIGKARRTIPPVRSPGRHLRPARCRLSRVPPSQASHRFAGDGRVSLLRSTRTSRQNETVVTSTRNALWCFPSPVGARRQPRRRRSPDRTLKT